MGQPLEWLESLQGSGIRPGLGRIRAILRNLGDPHRAYRSIIVAGTNGKGSTCAALNSILLASGYRTAMYTSPHLIDIRERWIIEGEPIDPDVLEACIESLRQASESAGITPTYFEALTIIAFIAFDRCGCEVAVLEVGMGGRLDATNVVRPIASVITPIGIDHVEYLGTTLRKIAGEKAGVIHRGAVVLTSNTDERIITVLRRRAERFGCAFHVVSERTAPGMPLAGEFQRGNIALAVRTAEELRPLLNRITDASIEQGVRDTRWRGRLERFDAGNKQVWIDGCHNGHAAIAVAPFVNEKLPRPRLLVFGIMGDKDVSNVAGVLFPRFDRIITTEAYPPRSARAEMLAELAAQLGLHATAVTDPNRAFALALESDAASVFIGGSLYLAGAAITFFDALREGGSDQHR